MGIECYLFTLHQETLAWLCDNPDSASSFVDALDTSPPNLIENLSRLPNAPAVIVDGLRSAQHDRIRTRTRLIELCPYPYMAEDLSAPCLDLDKSWQLLDIVLRQLSTSRSFALAECLRGVGIYFGHHPSFHRSAHTRSEPGNVASTQILWSIADETQGSESCYFRETIFIYPPHEDVPESDLPLRIHVWIHADSAEAMQRLMSALENLELIQLEKRSQYEGGI
jgi:hypothetical protein